MNGGGYAGGGGCTMNYNTLHQKKIILDSLDKK